MFGFLDRYLLFCFSLSGDDRVLHVRTHSFPPRRSSDLVRQAWARHAATGLAYRVNLRDVVGRTILRRQGYEPDLTRWLLDGLDGGAPGVRSEEHTSELQSLMRISYAVFCFKKKNTLNSQDTLKNNKREALNISKL